MTTYDRMHELFDEAESREGPLPHNNVRVWVFAEYNNGQVTMNSATISDVTRGNQALRRIWDRMEKRIVGKVGSR